jgi:hypothetical protein
VALGRRAESALHPEQTVSTRPIAVVFELALSYEITRLFWVVPLPFLALAALSLPRPDGVFIREATSRINGPVVSIELFVDPDGKVLDCKVLVPTLSEDKNAQICGPISGKDSGAGAKGPDGPTYGVIVVSKVLRADFGLAGPPMPNITPDLEIDVSQMPGKEQRKRVGLTVYIDEHGKVQRCLPEPGKDLEFSRTACQQSAANVFPIKRGKTGEPVGYVTGIAVDFVRDQTSNR